MSARSAPPPPSTPAPSSRRTGTPCPNRHPAASRPAAARLEVAVPWVGWSTSPAIARRDRRGRATGGSARWRGQGDAGRGGRCRRPGAGAGGRGRRNAPQYHPALRCTLARLPISEQWKSLNVSERGGNCAIRGGNKVAEQGDGEGAALGTGGTGSGDHAAFGLLMPGTFTASLDLRRDRHFHPAL